MSGYRGWRLGLLPVAAFYLAFFLLPMADFLRASLYQSTGPAEQGTTLTIQNYVAALSDPFLRRALLNTLRLCVFTSVLATMIAYPIAYTIARSATWGRVLFVVVVTVMFTSAVPRAMGWKSLIGSGGVLPVSDGFTAVMIATIHAGLPLAVIGLMPVCEAIPRNLLEASQGLGASSWTVFWRVILPQTERGVVAVALLIFAVTAGAFTTPALVGGGRVALLSILVRQEVLQVLDFGRGTTYAVILLALATLVAVVTALVAARRAGHEAIGAAPV